MFVLAQSQIAVFFAVEANQRLAITTTLLAQAQRHSASKHAQARTVHVDKLFGRV